MLSGEDGMFIDVTKLDLRKYASRRGLARALVLYILHVVNDTAKAMELAAHATEAARFQDWWWKGTMQHVHVCVHVCVCVCVSCVCVTF